MKEKELRDKAFAEQWEVNLKKDLEDKRRLGFIVQELQQVFPELVSQDKDGYLAVDYIGLIPVIVEGMKEQNRIIETLSAKITALENRINNNNETPGLRSATETSGKNQPVQTERFDAVLFQNTPNPFRMNTIIKYFLPVGIADASLRIYDMQGKQLKSIPVMQRGEGSVQIQGSELTAGMYLYALIADNKVVDTKQMILAK